MLTGTYLQSVWDISDVSVWILKKSNTTLLPKNTDTGILRIYSFNDELVLLLSSPLSWATTPRFHASLMTL